MAQDTEWTPVSHDTCDQVAGPFYHGTRADLAVGELLSAGFRSNYRDSVSPWFRSLWILHPDVASMSRASLSYKVHTLVGMALFILWPFTRLVHALTAPVHYLFRPYIVYRSRDSVATTGSRPTRPGWSSVGTRDREK